MTERDSVVVADLTSVTSKRTRGRTLGRTLGRNGRIVSINGYAGVDASVTFGGDSREYAKFLWLAVQNALREMGEATSDG